MPTPIENNTVSLETVMGKINGVSSEVNTQATQIEEIMTLLEGKTYDSASLQQKVVTPTAASQIITADDGYEALSQVTVNGDANLIARNIAEGVSIFGITGTHSGGIFEDEMCTVTINWSGSGSPNTLYVYTINQYLNSYVGTITNNKSETFQVSKKSIMFVSRNSIELLELKAIEGDVTTFSDANNNIFSIAFQINSDCELTLRGYRTASGDHND